MEAGQMGQEPRQPIQVLYTAYRGTLRAKLLTGGKSKGVRKHLFPNPPTPDLSDLTNQIYEEKEAWKEITRQEVSDAINRAATGKASGPDEIPTEIIKSAASILLEPLWWTSNQCMELGYHPQHFRKSITVILRKIGKEDYSQPKSYRPIALLNTLGKVLESIIAIRIT